MKCSKLEKHIHSLDYIRTNPNNYKETKKAIKVTTIIPSSISITSQ